jgi:hypothetical protein
MTPAKTTLINMRLQVGPRENQLRTPSLDDCREVYLLWVVRDEGSNREDYTTHVAIGTTKKVRATHASVERLKNCLEHLVVQVLAKYPVLLGVLQLAVGYVL